MLEIQKYLINKVQELGDKNLAIAKLKEDFGINARTHSDHDNIILFKYDQLESPMGERIVQECRGIILNANDWSIVARPYDKFFNIEEGHAADIDWDSARIFEKLDGSILSIYFYNGEWFCSTSGTPDAFGQVHGFNFSFKELFWNVWNELGYTLPSDEDKTKTFMFELMTPYNRIVVPHKENKLVLHGVRDSQNGDEFNPEDYCVKYGWNCVKTFPFATKEEAMSAIAELDGMACEGFVVVDGKFNRVKMKCLEYVKYAQLKSGLSLRSILEIVRNNEETEFLAYFPEYAEYYNEIKVLYEAFVTTAETLYNTHKDIVDQKEFALAVKDSESNFISFALRKNKFDSAKACIKEMDIKRLEQILKINNINISNI